MRRAVFMFQLKKFPEDTPLDELPDDLREAVGEAWRRGVGEFFDFQAGGLVSSRRRKYRERCAELDSVIGPIVRRVPKKAMAALLAREDDRSLRRVFDALKVMLAKLRKESKTESAFQQSLGGSAVLKRLIAFCEKHVDVFEVPEECERDERLSADLFGPRVPRLCLDAHVAHAVRHLLNALVDDDVNSALFSGGGVVKAAQLVTSRMSGLSTGEIERITRNPGY